jgi:hypothetical protein
MDGDHFDEYTIKIMLHACACSDSKLTSETVNSFKYFGRTP